jgi:hypothetical protein
MSQRLWYVVATMTGLRCEQHLYAPDNALSGPYRSGDIAAIAMQRMIERDRWEMIAGWVVIVGFSVTVTGWLVWTVAGWV